MAPHASSFHDYLEAEDVGMAVVKFGNGAIGTIEGSVNVYPKNLEETLYLFGETGTVKIGGTSTNDIDVWGLRRRTRRWAFERLEGRDVQRVRERPHAPVCRHDRGHLGRAQAVRGWPWRGAMPWRWSSPSTKARRRGALCACR